MDGGAGGRKVLVGNNFYWTVTDSNQGFIRIQQKVIAANQFHVAKITCKAHIS